MSTKSLKNSISKIFVMPLTCRYLSCVIAAFILAVVMLTGCNRHDRNRVVLARVDNSFLYLDQVESSIPDGAKETDSIFAVRSFVDNWIRRQLLLNHAEENLRDMKPDFERQLQDYRNALLIYTYEQELVQQNLDTIVSVQELKDYYEKNKESFLLKENIVKVLYVRLYRNEPTINQFRRLMRSDEQNDRLKLAQLAKQNAANYYLDDEAWLFFNDLLKEIPIVTYNQEAFLTNNRFVEIQDSSYYYLINIKDFRVTDSYSPITLEQDRIRYTIINMRKAEIISNLQAELYDRALRKNRFETFY